jgi:hypothetical protein
MTTFNRPRPHTFDHPLRYWVHSYSREDREYLVQLDSYGFNGECQCEDFACKFGPLLDRCITPQEALAGELVDEREGKRPEDALRCRHILDAMLTHSEDFSRAIIAAEQPTNEQTTKEENGTEKKEARKNSKRRAADR